MLLPDWMPEEGFAGPPRDAAVLIGLVHRGEALSVLYTERSPDLRSHSGQVAFPGGKIDPEDGGPAAAALREANEEVALDPADARVIFRTAGPESPLPAALPSALQTPWLYHEWQSRVLHAQDRSSIYGGFHIYARRG